MTNAITIARKELRIYFASPLFYVMTALFVSLNGFFFSLNVIQSNQASLATNSNITLFIMLFVAPILTMRLIALEKQQGTIELLLTNPVSDVEVVIGKYFAAIVMFAVMLAFTLVSVLILLWTAVDRQQFLFLNVGRVDAGPLLADYIGNVLIMASFMAIGLFTSSFTQNQIVAAVASFAVLLFLLIAGNAAQVFPDPVNTFLAYISPRDHLDAFARGSIGLPDVVYALSMIGVPLYLSVIALGARRWH